MCEPSHSIIQFPTEISGVDYLPRVEAATQQIQQVGTVIGSNMITKFK